MPKFTIDSDKAAQIEKDAALAEIMSKRRVAYQCESDPLIMEMIRGETDKTLGRVPTREDVSEKIAAIKQRYPKNTKE